MTTSALREKQVGSGAYLLLHGQQLSQCDTVLNILNPHRVLWGSSSNDSKYRYKYKYKYRYKYKYKYRYNLSLRNVILL